MLNFGPTTWLPTNRQLHWLNFHFTRKQTEIPLHVHVILFPDLSPFALYVQL